MAKKITFSVDYSRSNLASKISWINEDFDIKDCEPFIDYIRCITEDEYVFLHADKGEITNVSLFMFEAIFDPTDGNYFLCYSADFEVRNESAKKIFFSALRAANNQVEIVLGFKDVMGAVIKDPFEEIENRTAIMTKN
jgi:hypothetical protein